MMGWYGYGSGMSGWGWVAMTVTTVLFWALLITAGVLIARALWTRPRPAGPTGRPGPEQVLAERFARGEIDEQEYRDRLAALQEAVAGPSSRT